MVCLSEFKLPEPDVRLIIFGGSVYKIKLRYRPTSAAEENNVHFWKDSNIRNDIEKILRYVLYNKADDDLEPIRTDQLIVYPYKKEWANAQKLRFYKNDVRLKTSHYLYLLYIERVNPTIASPPQANMEQEPPHAADEAIDRVEMVDPPPQRHRNVKKKEKEEEEEQNTDSDDSFSSLCNDSDDEDVEGRDVGYVHSIFRTGEDIASAVKEVIKDNSEIKELAIWSVAALLRIGIK